MIVHGFFPRLVFPIFFCLTAIAQPTARKQPDLRFGIVLVKTNGDLAISAVVGQTAYDAGLRPRQVIKQINGRSTADMTVEQGVEAMKVPAGSKVDLEIIKPGQTNPEHVQVTRSPFVYLKPISDRTLDSNVGVLTIRTLDLDGGAKMREALENFKRKGVSKVILDFRDNGGGYRKTAIDIANLFLKKQCVLWITKYKEREEIENATPANAWSGPVLVLVNGATASGAELIASSLQLNGRAKVAGENTMGAATIRSAPKPNAPLVTIGVYLNAKRVEINGRGVKPDFDIDTNGNDEAVIARAAALLN